MPLRDHYRPPVWNQASWEGFFGGWPAMIVLQLVRHLPSEFTAEPFVHLGPYIEFDPSAEEGLTCRIDTDLSDQHEYEVRVYDQSRGRMLVAAVELVSPANKDRPEKRRAFVTKCAALLEQGVCVSIVDLVTTRSFNLYADLLALIDSSDPAFEPEPPPIYAVTCRGRTVDSRSRLESWAYPLEVGQPLPTLPLWLSADLAISLELEASYEETCRVLRIGGVTA